MPKHKLFNLFPSKNFIQILYAYIVFNIKSCQTLLILNCVLLQQMCVNHPKVLTSEKLSSPSGLFGFKSFHEFVVLGGRIRPIACLEFLVIKKWGNFYKKTISRRVAKPFLGLVPFSKFRAGWLKFHMFNLISNIFKVPSYEYMCK